MNTPKKLAAALCALALPLAACGDDDEDELDDIDVTVDDTATTIGSGSIDSSLPTVSTAPMTAPAGTDSGSVGTSAP